MKENVLIVGSGGREHSLAWKLGQSDRVRQIFVAPGNGGTQKIARNVAVKATDIDSLLQVAMREGIGLTIVGSEDALERGIVDLFRKNKRKIVGPTKLAAEIETSKLFAKGVMDVARVNTASYRAFDDSDRALEYVRRHRAPVVVKVDGLALGKGARVCKTVQEAEQAIKDFMIERIHGAAGATILIEDLLKGQEISVHAFCDGKTFKLCPSAQDHKPAFDGDQGPNTGGMGTIAPVPWFTPGMLGAVGEEIVGPVFEKLFFLARPFVGMLYPGLMITESGPSVLEFNARPGDPETQSYMRLLKTDLLDIGEACVNGTLHNCDIEWNPGYAATVVLASGGYPGEYKKGYEITGISEAEKIPDVVVFHAGTTVLDDRLVTSGGRVLGVSAIGKTLEETLQTAYKAVDCIHFEGMQFRRDIGAKALEKFRAQVAMSRVLSLQ